MKRNRTLLFLLLALTGITFIFFFQKNNSTLKKELSDFAVKDTSAITKIFLADRNGNTVTLEKKDNNVWILNGKYEPRPDLLQLFIETVYKLEVKARVANAAYNNVVKALSATGIKCEIFLHNRKDPYKVYYVGGQTENSEGTFMILENSSVPFITEVAGFQGYLTPRYSVDVDAWRNTMLFSTSPADIRSVSVLYSNYPDKSFSIKLSDNRYIIESEQSKVYQNTDSVALENYLRLYQKVYFESFPKNVKPQTLDSLLRLKPPISIRLTLKNNTTKSVDLFPMPITERSLTREDSLGNPLKYDLDRMYGYIKPGNELVTLQYYSIEKLLRRLEDFVLRP